MSAPLPSGSLPADELNATCLGLARRAKAAARALATVPAAAKNRWLSAAAGALLAHQDELLAANAKDVAAAPGFGLNAAAVDRLTLNPKRIAAAAEGLRQVAALPDPVGEVREATERPNGLQVLKVGVPLGVVFFIYESRPNVTA
ncbi:MAG TPA: gamma-glutamyl-phosphate reductase, partial [Gemmata sp.]